MQRYARPPDPAERRQPAQARIRHGPEQARIGEVVRERPDPAGAQPAPLPVVGPDGPAQRRKGSHEHERQVQALGERIRRGRRQRAQHQREPEEEDAGEHVVRAVKDRADPQGRRGQPQQQGKARRAHGERQQRGQAHPRQLQRGGDRVEQHVRAAAVRAVHLHDREQRKQQPADHAARQRGVGQVDREHGGARGGRVEPKARQRRDQRQKENRPRLPAPQEPPAFQAKAPHRLHGRSSWESR